MPKGTVKVPFALDAAIVLSAIILELDAHPIATSEMRSTGEAYDASPAV